MTAADILTSWRAIAPVFNHRTAAWVLLLEVAESGPPGVSALALGKRHNIARHLKNWEAAGLVTTSRERGRARPRLRLHITKKGLKFLRLEATEPRTTETE